MRINKLFMIVVVFLLVLELGSALSSVSAVCLDNASPRHDNGHEHHDNDHGLFEKDHMHHDNDRGHSGPGKDNCSPSYSGTLPKTNRHEEK